MPYLMFFFFLIVAIMGASFWPVVGFLLFQLPFMIFQIIASAIGVPLAKLSKAILCRETWIYTYFLYFNLCDFLAFFLFFISKANGDLTFGKVVICIACVIASFAWVRPAMMDSKSSSDSDSNHDIWLPKWLERELDGDPPKKD